MEKRTANKARRWNNEMTVERSRRKERELKEQSITMGEYIPRRYIEPLYSETEVKAKNNERLLLYFFIGVIICIVVWKGFDAVRERYWMDELGAGSQKFLTALEKENQKTREELKKLTPSYKPMNANSYQIKVIDHLKGSVCQGHVKSEIYESKTLRCIQRTNQCTTISTRTYSKEGYC
ncbi:hypothetical protein [Methylobacter sp.]|uniref:hypothetical protein n=1 Tax=Methylobacter sp. TaxID=2051955 RepID=UPI003DA34181